MPLPTHVRTGCADAGQLAEIKSAAQYLHARRSYRGLETPHHTGAEAKEASVAVPGRSGRAAQYTNEPDTSKGEASKSVDAPEIC